jgi:hypothetical protein
MSGSSTEDEVFGKGSHHIDLGGSTGHDGESDSIGVGRGLTECAANGINFGTDSSGSLTEDEVCGKGSHHNDLGGSMSHEGESDSIGVGSGLTEFAASGTGSDGDELDSIGSACGPDNHSVGCVVAEAASIDPEPVAVIYDTNVGGLTSVTRHGKGRKYVDGVVGGNVPEGVVHHGTALSATRTILRVQGKCKRLILNADIPLRAALAEGLEDEIIVAQSRIYINKTIQKDLSRSLKDLGWATQLADVDDIVYILVVSNRWRQGDKHSYQ